MGKRLCQAKVKLEVIVEVAVKSRAEAVIKVGVQLLLWLGGMWGKWVVGWLGGWRIEEYCWCQLKLEFKFDLS